MADLYYLINNKLGTIYEMNWIKGWHPILYDVLKSE